MENIFYIDPKVEDKKCHDIILPLLHIYEPSIHIGVFNFDVNLSWIKTFFNQSCPLFMTLVGPTVIFFKNSLNHENINLR